MITAYMKKKEKKKISTDLFLYSIAPRKQSQAEQKQRKYMLLEPVS